MEETTRRPMPEVNAFFEKLEAIFHRDDFTKAQVVEAIKEFIPNFEHEEGLYAASLLPKQKLRASLVVLEASFIHGRYSHLKTNIWAMTRTMLIGCFWRN